MALLTNDFSWSPSRQRMFSTCVRRYYYNYYGSWEGWSNNAAEETRLLYRLKKMVTLPILTGSLLHDAIDRILKICRSGRQTSLSAATQELHTAFSRKLQESEQELWRNRPSKATNLFEHYYKGDGLDDGLIAAKDRLSRCLEAFYDSSLFSDLRDLEPHLWLSQETLDAFSLDGTKIWVALDLAVRRDGDIAIYDWKTGSEREADRTQLAVYALYASEKWQIAADRLLLEDIYLASGASRTHGVDQRLLKDTRVLISKSVQEMQSRLTNVEGNKASIGDFPMVEDWNICRTCSFREVCLPEQEQKAPAASEQLTLGF